MFHFTVIQRDIIDDEPEGEVFTKEHTRTELAVWKKQGECEVKTVGESLKG